MFLAIDTALDSCTAGIGSQKGLLAGVAEPMRYGQAEALFTIIDRLQSEAGICPADYTALGVTCGPGSFTGIRTGIAAVRGLGLALDIPVYGLTSFAALHASADIEGKPACIVIESRRADFFAQLFNGTGDAITEPLALSGADLVKALAHKLAPQTRDSFVLAGNGAERFAAEQQCGLDALPASMELLTKATQTNATALVRLTAEKHAQGHKCAATPLYLRPPDVAKPKKSNPPA